LARANREALASTLAFAVGGAAVAAGIVLVVTAPRGGEAKAKPASAAVVDAPRDPDRVTLEARVSPGSASLQVRW